VTRLGYLYYRQASRCLAALHTHGSTGHYIRSSSTTFIGKASPNIKPTTVSTFDAVPPELHKSLLQKAADNPVRTTAST
jgi:hypothetical protein